MRKRRRKRRKRRMSRGRRRMRRSFSIIYPTKANTKLSSTDFALLTRMEKFRSSSSES